jgi:hypothetical protein
VSLGVDIDLTNVNASSSTGKTFLYKYLVVSRVSCD